MVGGGGAVGLGRPVATESKGQEPDLAHSFPGARVSFHECSYRAAFVVFLLQL